MSSNSWEFSGNEAKTAQNNGLRRRARKERSYEQLLKDDPSGMAMLDQALEGASAEEKARVRGVLLRFGIETDHEFYIIFVAIGQLLVLVEEAPENWRSLFDDVHAELKQWSQENFKSLESIQRHAQTSAELITVLRRLLDSMKTSEARSSETKTTLNSLSRKLSSIENSLDSMRSWSGREQGTLSRIDEQVELLSLGENHRTWISVFSGAFSVLVIIALVMSHWAMMRRMNFQEQLIMQQTVRMSWLLEKANRQECLSGIKPADDPQCRQYF